MTAPSAISKNSSLDAVASGCAIHPFFSLPPDSPLLAGVRCLTRDGAGCPESGGSGCVPALGPGCVGSRWRGEPVLSCGDIAGIVGICLRVGTFQGHAQVCSHLGCCNPSKRDENSLEPCRAQALHEPSFLWTRRLANECAQTPCPHVSELTRVIHEQP